MKLLSARQITIGVVVLLAAANAALTATTLYVSLRGRPTLVVPGVKREQVSLPSHVPDEALRHFAILYLLKGEGCRRRPEGSPLGISRSRYVL